MADKKAYALRLSPEVWTALQQAAAQDLRSVNGEIEALLVEALAARGRKVKSSENEDAPNRKSPAGGLTQIPPHDSRS